MTITVGQLLALEQALAGAAVGLRGLNVQNLSQDAAVGEEILDAVAIFWPPAALLETALEIAVILAPMARPDPDPIHDAQTSTGRGPRSA